MCGIIGCSLKRPLNDEDIARLRRGRLRLAHRGPDGDGEWFDVDSGVYLGHRRLAIIDLSDGSRQPMQVGPRVMTYNGELYNFRELRQQLLGLGERFETTGDTEVVIKSWQYWGKDCLNHFDGMFVLAIFDGARLFIANDAFGEKPIYVYQASDGIYFSSELSALAACCDLTVDLTTQDTYDFLTLGFIRPPRTGFKQVSVLRPASLLEIQNGRRVEETRYWAPETNILDKSRLVPMEKRDVEAIKACLIRSLEVRLRSDVPLGLFLSSGIDSSLVAALAAKELGVKLNTYTVSFSDGFDESGAAQRIAQHLQLPHMIIDSKASLSESNDKTIPEELLDIYGGPNDNLTALSIRQMSRLIKPYATVALSGLGGDELFFGYNKYHFFFRRQKELQAGKKLFPIVKTINRLGFNVGKLGSRFNAIKANDDAMFLNVKVGMGEPYERLQSVRDFEGVQQDVFAFAQDELPLYLKARWFDVRETLPCSYIPSVDRGSMRASVEVRTPYLNRELLTKISSYHPDSFFNLGHKGVLKNMLGDYLPESLLPRAKRGFVFPAQRYLQGAEKSFDALTLDRTFVDEIWSNKNRLEFSTLAFRLAVLDTFAASGISGSRD